ncbi:MAG: penicillin-binding protein 1C [Anaerolineae bacterium]|nr:penicillin-binding protein 1C [Anaerolineae bacterium]
MARIRRWLMKLVLISLLGSGLGIGAFALWIGPLPDPMDLRRPALLPSVRILDRHGRLLYEIAHPHQGRHAWIPLHRIPRSCINATLATEDARFYEHPGVDPIAILRALWINLRREPTISGASTIPQQIARSLLLSPDERTARTLRRKAREAILALMLSQRYGKDELLEIYLNTMFYGHFAYGLEAAALTYFGKHATELDLAECALLAGLPQSPGHYDPFTNPQAAEKRRQQVLQLMVRHGFLSPEEAEMAAAEGLRFASAPFSIQAPHFVMAVREALAAQFGEEGMFEEGLVVTTTLDLAWNEAIAEILRARLEEINRPRPDRPGAGARNGAVLVIHPRTGEILAWVGSPDYFNAAIQGAVDGVRIPRQPGSALKPFTYALAFDPRSGPLLTPASLLWDLPQTFLTAEGESYQPINYDRRYHGPVSARVALASSLNVPAVIVLERVGVHRLVELLDQLGVQLPGPPIRYGLALTLGGGEVRLIDLTAAYAALANGGRRVTPTLIREVRDRRGQLRYAPLSEPGPQVLDPRVVFLITDILKDPNARALGFGSWSPLNLSRPAAVKTGTSSDWRDNWTIGYTPDWVVGVWIGNVDQTPLREISGVSGAAPIWRAVMELLHRGQPARDFPIPEGVHRMTVCALSGKRPTPDCPQTREEWFIQGTEPQMPDDLYRRLRINRRTGELAGPETLPEEVEERVFIMWPPSAWKWAQENGFLLPPLEAYEGAIGMGALRWVSPATGVVYRRVLHLAPEAQQLLVELHWVGPGLPRWVRVEIDGEPWMEWTRPPYRAWWPLRPGTHRFTASAQDAEGSIIQAPLLPIEVR